MNYEKIYKLTEKNYHTEARIEIARGLAKKTLSQNYVNIFIAIQKIQDIKKHIPLNLHLYREEETKDMLEAVKLVFGDKVLEDLNKCI